MKFASRMDALKPSDIREAMKMIAANAYNTSACGCFYGSLPFRVERHIPYQIHGQALAFCKGLPGR